MRGGSRITMVNRHPVTSGDRPMAGRASHSARQTSTAPRPFLRVPRRRGHSSPVETPSSPMEAAHRRWFSQARGDHPGAGEPGKGRNPRKGRNPTPGRQTASQSGRGRRDPGRRLFGDHHPRASPANAGPPNHCPLLRVPRGRLASAVRAQNPTGAGAPVHPNGSRPSAPYQINFNNGEDHHARNTSPSFPCLHRGRPAPLSASLHPDGTHDRRHRPGRRHSHPHP